MLTLRQVPIWMDNYAYLLAHDDEAIVVDAPEAEPLLDAAKEMGVRIVGVLNTHHHPDHVGANADLVKATSCDIFGAAHDAERIPHLSRSVEVGSHCDVIGLRFRILDVRAHTLGHIAYALDTPIDVVIKHGHRGEPTRSSHLEKRPALFVGDSLFAGGCGRLFEGSPTQLHASMATLRREDERALVVCAHEYTSSNLAFAKSVSGGADVDLLVAARLRNLDADMGAAKSSVPSILEQECESNPFMVALDPNACATFAQTLGCENDVTAVIGALRKAKDNF